MSQGQKKQLDIASGQSELFSDEKNLPISAVKKEQAIINPSNDELVRERKVLGYYLSSHPINKYKDELYDMKLKKISELNNTIINNTSSKITTTVSGVILDSRSQKIGKSKYINIFKVDDGSQYINISFFEEKYLKYKNLLREDSILFFHGESFIDDYDSQLSMRAENVFTLDEAREKFSKYIKIILSSDNITKDKIHAVKKLLQKIILKNKSHTVV